MGKYIRFNFVAVFAFLCVFVAPNKDLFAAGEVDLIIGDAAATAGTTISVPVTIFDLSPRLLLSLQINFQFDGTVLTNARAVQDIGSTGYVMTVTNPTANDLNIVILTTPGAASSITGIIYWLTFDVAPLAASGPYQVIYSSVQAYDEVASIIPNGQQAIGTITVTAIPAPEIEVSGLGTVILDGDTTPVAADDTDYGTWPLASSSAHTFTITNVGDVVLNLTGAPIVAISGSSMFSVTTQPAATTVAVLGGTRTFVVTFAPTGAGVQNATVSIANDDATENPYTFSVTGTGTANTVVLVVTDPITLPAYNEAGNPTSANGNVSFNGPTTTWSATATTGTFYTLSSASGVGNGFFVVTANNNLVQGSYAGTITVTAPGAANVVVNVALTVNAPSGPNANSRFSREHTGCTLAAAGGEGTLGMLMALLLMAGMYRARKLVLV